MLARDYPGTPTKSKPRSGSCLDAFLEKKQLNLNKQESEFDEFLVRSGRSGSAILSWFSFPPAVTLTGDF